MRSRHVYFEELSGTCGIRWRLLDPLETVRFNDQAMCSADPGKIAIEITGAHTLVVEGAAGTLGSSRRAAGFLGRMS